MPRDTSEPVASRDIVARWYALALEGGEEERTRDRLKRRHAEWPLWLPLCEETLRRRARNVPCVEPLYPGYGFVQLERPRGAMDALLGVDGVLGLVEIAGAFGWLPDGRVAALRAAAEHPDDERWPDGLIRFKHAIQVLFLRGQQVKIMDRDHPAHGLVGEVMAVKSKDRVKLMMESLRTFDVPASMLARVG